MAVTDIVKCFECGAKLPENPDRPCSVCGACRVCGDLNVATRGRCASCYQFLRRTKRDRTEEQVLRAGERAIHRDRPDSGFVRLFVQRRLRENSPYRYMPWHQRNLPRGT